MPAWRPITSQDREAYLAMTSAFYSTDAVMHPIPRSHMEATFEELMRRDTYAAAYICEEQDTILGYALLAKTFSQEAGGTVLWVEELFIKEAYRGKGYGKQFFEYLLSSLPADVKRVRLEVERDNTAAVRMYEYFGFSFFEYDQMALERE